MVQWEKYYVNRYDEEVFKKGDSASNTVEERAASGAGTRAPTSTAQHTLSSHRQGHKGDGKVLCVCACVHCVNNRLPNAFYNPATCTTTRHGLCKYYAIGLGLF